MTAKPFSILITGCSHTGKSTLAAALAQKLGFQTIHTDQLARHPGRPWPAPKPQVKEFYRSLSKDALFWLLQAHYENFQFQIHKLIEQQIAQNAPFIFEGSALRPELVKLPSDIKLHKICLSADEALLRNRIYESCGWEHLDVDTKELVEAFIGRTLLDNQELVGSAQSNGFELFQINDQSSIDELSDYLCGGNAPP